jgi:hypothetical protein
MPIKDTGMDVYESAMAPMRQNIQGIFAHQAKERAAREALAAEERADARKIATEERANARTLAAEQRRIDQAEDFALEMSIAEANRYGLTTEGKNSAQLNQDIAAHKEKLGPQGRLMSNIDVIREYKLLSEEEIGRLTRGEMKKAEMEGMEARFKPAIDTWRKSQADELVRNTPGWQRKFEASKARYTELAGELSELKGEEIRERADGIIADYEAGNQTAMTQERIASTLTLSQPGMEVIFSDYKLLTENWKKNAGKVIIGDLPVHDPDGPDGPMLPMNMWHQDFPTEARTELLAAWGQASQQAFEAAKTDAEIKYWTAKLKLDKNVASQQSSNARAKEIRDEMRGITTAFPTMNRYNVMTGEFTKPLFRSAQEPKPESVEGDPLAEIESARAARAAREEPQGQPLNTTVANGGISTNPREWWTPVNEAAPQAVPVPAAPAPVQSSPVPPPMPGVGGYLHREGTPEGYPALLPQQQSTPLDAQAVSEITEGRPATSREAQEGLSRMREALYGGFAQPGDYDPRLPGAIEAIRGQLGQAPPSMGQLLPREQEAEKIRRNMDVGYYHREGTPEGTPALLDMEQPPEPVRKLRAGNNWWARNPATQ